MSELEMTNEAETEEFTDELCDEAIDREEEHFSRGSCYTCRCLVQLGRN
jgi:hypothetical protein